MANRNIIELANDRSYPGLFDVKASGHIYIGDIIALDGTLKAVPASDAAGLKVLGVAREEVVNTAGQVAYGTKIQAYKGIYLFDNSASAALTRADIGANALIEDAQTVAKTSTNSIAAGKVHDVTSEGVFVYVNPEIFGYPATAPSKPSGAATLTQDELTDSSGGTSSTTIAAIGATYDQAEVSNAIATIAAQLAKVKADISAVRTGSEANNAAIDAVIDNLTTAGIMA